MAISPSCPPSAVAAVDGLIDFVDTMFEGMESGIDAGLLDGSIEPVPGV
ncbi:hypothetical protein [Bradyrhizobium sp.]